MTDSKKLKTEKPFIDSEVEDKEADEKGDPAPSVETDELRKDIHHEIDWNLIDPGPGFIGTLKACDKIDPFLYCETDSRKFECWDLDEYIGGIFVQNSQNKWFLTVITDNSNQAPIQNVDFTDPEFDICNLAKEAIQSSDYERDIQESVLDFKTLYENYGYSEGPIRDGFSFQQIGPDQFRSQKDGINYTITITDKNNLHVQLEATEHTDSSFEYEASIDSIYEAAEHSLSLQ